MAQSLKKFIDSAQSNKDPVNQRIETFQKERPTEVNIFHANIQQHVLQNQDQQFLKLMESVNKEIKKLNDQQIQQYLQDKANLWKEILKQSCITLTKVWENESQLVKDLTKRLRVIQDQVNGIKNQAKSYIDKIEQQKKQIYEQSQKCDEIRFLINQLYNDCYDKKKEVKNAEELINEKGVQSLYKILEKQNPQILSVLAESMVALLRGKKNASPGDVQTYMKSYQSLKYKMNTVNPLNLSMETISKNEQKLLTIQANFQYETAEDYKLNVQFNDFLNWSLLFCLFCKSSQRLKQEEENQKKNMAILEQLEFELKKNKSCLDDLSIFDVDQLEQEKKIIEQYIRKVNSNLKAREDELKFLQYRYNDYESQFFSQINAYKKKALVHQQQTQK